MQPSATNAAFRDAGAPASCAGARKGARALSSENRRADQMSWRQTLILAAISAFLAGAATAILRILMEH